MLLAVRSLGEIQEESKQGRVGKVARTCQWMTLKHKSLTVPRVAARPRGSTPRIVCFLHHVCTPKQEEEEGDVCLCFPKEAPAHVTEAGPWIKKHRRVVVSRLSALGGVFLRFGAALRVAATAVSMPLAAVRSQVQCSARWEAEVAIIVTMTM